MATYPYWTQTQIFGLGQIVTYQPTGANYKSLGAPNQYHVPPSSPQWWVFYTGGGGNTVTSLTAGEGIKITNASTPTPTVSASLDAGGGIILSPGESTALTVTALIQDVVATQPSPDIPSGITITQPPDTGGALGVTNSGVLSLTTAGTGLNTLTSQTGQVTLTGSAVTAVTSPDNSIAVATNSTTGAVTVANAGVKTLANSDGFLSVSSPTGAVILGNLGVKSIKKHASSNAYTGQLELVPGTGVDINDTTTNSFAFTNTGVTSIQALGDVVKGDIVFQGSQGIDVQVAFGQFLVTNLGVTSLSSSGTGGSYTVRQDAILTGGTGIDIEGGGQTLTVSNTGVTSLGVVGSGGTSTGALALQAGTNVTLDNTTTPGILVINASGSGGGGVATVTGAGTIVNNTDPHNPVITAVKSIQANAGTPSSGAAVTLANGTGMTISEPSAGLYNFNVTGMSPIFIGPTGTTPVNITCPYTSAIFNFVLSGGGGGGGGGCYAPLASGGGGHDEVWYGGGGGGSGMLSRGQFPVSNMSVPIRCAIGAGGAGGAAGNGVTAGFGSLGTNSELDFGVIVIAGAGGLGGGPGNIDGISPDVWGHPGGGGGGANSSVPYVPFVPSSFGGGGGCGFGWNGGDMFYTVVGAASTGSLTLEGGASFQTQAGSGALNPNNGGVSHNVFGGSFPDATWFAAGGSGGGSSGGIASSTVGGAATAGKLGCGGAGGQGNDAGCTAGSAGGDGFCAYWYTVLVP